MPRIIFPILAVCLLSLFTALPSAAQIPSENGSQRERGGQEDLPKNIKETMAKQRIEREKKDYDDLLKRTEEAVKLSEELEQSYDGTGTISGEDQKKLDKLEKLVKKIRSDLGGSDDDTSDEKDADEETPATRQSAFKSLQAVTGRLFDEIKKSTRYSISAVAIQSSNALLKVLKFIRFGN